MIDAAAATDSVVLLRGESGTGKELLARRLHQKSRRAAGPYIRVNGAAVPLEMWESEFFGHRRGSFTGATADREGWFQLAHRGTLFLDEVGAMPAEAQPKLLRAIQDGEFHRLGDQQPTRVDVRIVAATNADLETDIKDGPLPRRPLLPPQRPADPGAAAARSARRHRAPGPRASPPRCPRGWAGPAPELDAETLARLRAYPWPGNVRELRSVIERALILHPGRGPGRPRPRARSRWRRRARTAAGRAAGVGRPHPAREPQPPGAVAASSRRTGARAASGARRRGCSASTRATSPTTAASTASIPTPWPSDARPRPRRQLAARRRAASAAGRRASRRAAGASRRGAAASGRPAARGPRRPPAPA